MMINIRKTDKKPNELNALTLAYIGDAIYELYIRNHVIIRGGKPNVYHQRSIKYVSARAQASIVHHIMPQLTEEEQDIVKRGRNAKSYTIPKNANMTDYRHSTAYEALIGYLYLTERIERLEEIVYLSIDYIERRDGEENERK